MAERRMFAKTIIDSDAFLDMPMSAQALYFHLGMRADDDGFVNAPRKIQRTVGASEDDLRLLVAKRFILVFDSGVIVIKHWRIHNYIRNDRYKPTLYKEEMDTLSLNENNAYTERDDTPYHSGIPDDIPTVYQRETQVRLGKDRIGKDSLDDSCGVPQSGSPAVVTMRLNDGTDYLVTEDEVSKWKSLYPAVDVEQELRNMAGWCDANPANRKTRSGVKRFITNWLIREQNKAPRMKNGPTYSGNDKGIAKYAQRLKEGRA